MKKILLIGFLCLSICTALPCFAGETLTDKVEKLYYDTLDKWVRDGGKVDAVNKIVVPTCGKLIMLVSEPDEKAGFMTYAREEWDARVDICVKMTVNRVHPQPEFKNKKFVSDVCDESGIPPFLGLCKKSGLR